MMALDSTISSQTMRPGRSGRLWAKLRIRPFRGSLLLRFTLLGFIITTLIAVMFSLLLSRKMIGDALDDAAHEAARTALTTITPEVAAADFGTPTPARVEAWKTRVGRVVAGDIVRVKVWDSKGTVLYSDDPDLIGKTFPLADQTELREALEGELAKELSALGKSENVRERGYGRLLEVYVPVQLPGSTRVIGVFEVYRRFEPLQQKILGIERFVWGGSVLAFGLLFTSLFALIRRASRQLSGLASDLVIAYDSTLEGWSSALDLRDQETEGHTRRVTEMTLRLVQAMGISDENLVHVRRGALLHDIGKMGIPDSILRKPGPLSDEEWTIMRRHPVYAHDMLSPIAYLRPALDIPYCHHERWDGTGYPRGLKSEQIPLVARLFAVVDVYDALSSDRPYQKRWSREQVLTYLRDQSGKHFDPAAVEAFLAIEPTFDFHSS